MKHPDDGSKSDRNMYSWLIIVYVTAYIMTVYLLVGRDSSVGIATLYGLDGPGIESLWRARFYVPVQTGPGARPVSYTLGTASLSPGGKAAGAWRWPPTHI
jgi:hypothetical protein